MTPPYPTRTTDDLPELDASVGPALPLSAQRKRVLVSAIVDGAFGARAPKRRRLPVHWALAALVIALTGVAAGVAMPEVLRSGMRRLRWTSAEQVPERATRKSDVSAPHRPMDKPQPPTSTTSTDPEPSSVPSAAVEHLPRVRVPTATPVPSKLAPETTNGQDLLQAANQLRGAGEWLRAERAYSEVARLHPGTSQSYVATLAAASLRLEHLGEPREALQLYRSMGASGPLTAEALFGAARCYRALGDTRAEAETLRQLVAAQPPKLLLKQAQSRLALLEGAQP